MRAQQIEEEAAAIFHVGEAHRNAAVATVMDEMRQKREKVGCREMNRRRHCVLPAREKKGSI